MLLMKIRTYNKHPNSLHTPMHLFSFHVMLYPDLARHISCKQHTSDLSYEGGERSTYTSLLHVVSKCKLNSLTLCIVMCFMVGFQLHIISSTKCLMSHFLYLESLLNLDASLMRSPSNVAFCR